MNFKHQQLENHKSYEISQIYLHGQIKANIHFYLQLGASIYLIIPDSACSFFAVFLQSWLRCNQNSVYYQKLFLAA